VNLGASRSAIASALGISQQAASKLERSATQQNRELAAQLAAQLEQSGS
jgi:DNA-binding XRE family transcriptional regulator